MKSDRPYDIITFDCYGTLIDWDAGIGGTLRRLAAEDGRIFREDDLLDAYHALEPVVEAEAHRRYRDVLAETALRVAARLHWPLTAERARLLAGSLPEWPPFPDTNPALERLAGAGYRLGILSNVDDDLLAGTRRHLAVRFDLLITAQQTGSYKPAPGHFVEARRRIGDARWLHAAQSYFHDIVPTHALGIPVVWINRTHEAPAGKDRPDREFSRLKELADWLA